jgi:hypothetical protein
MDANAFRESIVQALAQVGSENYKENSRIIGVLDDKAQRSGAIAGAFLAAGLGFIKAENFGPTSSLNRLVGLPGIILLGLSIAFLLISTMFSLRVMWIRPVPAPLSFEILDVMTSDLLNLPSADLDDARQENYYRDESSIWKAALKGQAQVISEKGKNLRAAQVLLSMAIFCIALLLSGMMAGVLFYRLLGR